MLDIDALNRELRAIEDAIAAVKARMPAHSAKPGMMTELIDLEDQRDKILEQIEFGDTIPIPALHEAPDACGALKSKDY